MDEFKLYLLSKKIVTKKKLPYYLNWITKFHKFCDIKPETPITSENIDRTLLVARGRATVSNYNNSKRGLIQVLKSS